MSKKPRIEYTWKEFERFVQKLRPQISKIQAFDAVTSSWQEDDVILAHPKNYDLIIITLKDASRIHVTIRSEYTPIVRLDKSALLKPKAASRFSIPSLSFEEEALLKALIPLLPDQFTPAELGKALAKLHLTLGTLVAKLAPIETSASSR